MNHLLFILVGLLLLLCVPHTIADTSTDISSAGGAHNISALEVGFGRMFNGIWNVTAGEIPIFFGTSGSAKSGPNSAIYDTRDLFKDEDGESDTDTLVQLIRDTIHEHHFRFMKTYVLLIDGEYMDDLKMEIGLVNVETLGNNSTEFYFFLEYIVETYGRDKKDILGENCTLLGIATYSELHFDVDGEGESPRMGLYGELGAHKTFDTASTPCDFRISLNLTEITEDEYIKPFMKYTLLSIVVSSLEIMLFILLWRHVNTASKMRKVSLPVLLWHSGMDVVLILFHMVMSMTIPTTTIFYLFTYISFMKMILLIFFEIPLSLKIWRSHGHIQNATARTLRQYLFKFYLKVYVALIVALFLLMQFNSLLWPYLFIIYSFWIPQIYKNVKERTSNPFPK